MNQLKNKIFYGGNLEVVKDWPSNFISAIVTDPPYGLGFMGKDWDTFKDAGEKSQVCYQQNLVARRQVKNAGKSGLGSLAQKAGAYDFSRNPEFQQWFTVWAKAMLRITKPGGFLLCFGGTRTYHRLACAIEDAGWEIRDCMMWLYGSGFPKSHNISKAIDKASGARRQKIPNPKAKQQTASIGTNDYGDYNATTHITPNPITNLAQFWNGYGTALKPAWEPIIVAMKPLDGTFAQNAEKHGVAGLNIDGGRIGTEDEIGRDNRNVKGSVLRPSDGWNQNSMIGLDSRGKSQGRWPANLILDEEAGTMLDEQTGTKKSGFMAAGTKRQMSDNPNKNTYGKFNPDTVANDTYGDSGGASRFFYCAKCSRRERNMGLDDQSGKKVNDGRQTPIDNPYQRGETIRKNTHPTVKPLALMKYLCTLLKMPSAEQIILDPFMGSGTTGIACKELGINFIGIEKEREYCEIAVKRIAAVEGQEITLEAEIKAPVSERIIENPIPVSEHRQSIINAAVAALREKRS